MVAGLWWASPTRGVPVWVWECNNALARGKKTARAVMKEQSSLHSLCWFVTCGSCFCISFRFCNQLGHAAGPLPPTARAPSAPVSLLCIPAVPCTWHHCPLVSCPLFLDHPLCFSGHHKFIGYFLLDSSFLHLPKLLLAWSGFGSFSSNFCKAKKTPGDYFASVTGKVSFYQPCSLKFSL